MTGRRATSFGTHARTHAHGEREGGEGEESEGETMDGDSGSRRGSRLCRSGVVCASVIHHIHAYRTLSTTGKHTANRIAIRRAPDTTVQPRW